jgi:hypothetical protein
MQRNLDSVGPTPENFADPPRSQIRAVAQGNQLALGVVEHAERDGKVEPRVSVVGQILPRRGFDAVYGVQAALREVTADLMSRNREQPGNRLTAPRIKSRPIPQCALKRRGRDVLSVRAIADSVGDERVDAPNQQLRVRKRIVSDHQRSVSL